jgi:hypothetical protein
MSPTESCVTPNAIPIESASTTTGPRDGLSNQPVAPKIATKLLEIAKADAYVTQKVLRDLPIIEAQNNPLTSPIPIIQPRGICGSRKKLLNEIARYSFKRTATQKTGREKRRNAINVIE